MFHLCNSLRNMIISLLCHSLGYKIISSVAFLEEQSYLSSVASPVVIRLLYSHLYSSVKSSLLFEQFMLSFSLHRMRINDMRFLFQLTALIFLPVTFNL